MFFIGKALRVKKIFEKTKKSLHVYLGVLSIELS